MTDHLVVTPANGRISISISRDDDPAGPHDWQKYERDHPGAWFRKVTDEEQVLGFDELWQRAISEHAARSRPTSHEIGTLLTLREAVSMMKHSLLARKVLTHADQTFEAYLTSDGIMIVRQPMRNI